MNKQIHYKMPFVALLMLCIGVTPLFADDCAALVMRALEMADAACNTLERNQVCYSNDSLEAIVYPDVAPQQFAQPGDRLDLNSINALHVNTLDEISEQWGIAVLKVQANLPETQPEQNVTILLLGDTYLSEVDTTVFAQSTTYPLTPMQAIYLQTGIGNPACNGVPNGILIQSPAGGPRATLNINDAWVSFGSTLFVQSSPETGEMTISTLSGAAQVSAQGTVVNVIQGAQTSLSLDAAGSVASIPAAPVPLTESQFSALVSAVNETSLITPTYADLSSDPAVQALQLTNPLTPQNPVQAASVETIEHYEIDDSLIPLPDDIPDIEIPMPPKLCPECIKLPGGEVVGPATPSTEDPIEYPTPTMQQVRITNGEWRRDRNIEVTVNGTCYAGIGGGDDMGGGGDVEIPLVTICQSADSGMVSVDGNNLSKLEPNIYTSESTSQRLIIQNGRTVGTYLDTNHQELRIVDSGHVQLIITSQESDGGCSTRTVINYRLVQASTSSAICMAGPMVVTVTAPTPTPDSMTPVATEPPLPPGDEQHIRTGAYRLPDTLSATCDETNKPTFSEFNLDFDAQGNMLIMTTTDTYTLFNVGSGYQYINGPISMQANQSNGDYILRYFSMGMANNPCMVEISLSDSGDTISIPATSISPTPMQDAVSDGYTVDFIVSDDSVCPDALRQKLPDFSQATAILQPDGSLLIDYGTGSYSLSDQGGYKVYQEFGSDGSFTTLNAYSLTSTGGVSDFMYMNAQGQACIAQLQLMGK